MTTETTNKIRDNSHNLNLDFTQFACSHVSDQNWINSPVDGVSRMPLEREFAEHGHTTSFVIFSPDSYFPAHTHPMGEEIVVLEGVFSDEFGDYPAGTYLRNPPNSTHSPFTKHGCKLFVKLDQFNKNDTSRIVLPPHDRKWLQGHGNLKVLSLHEFETQHTALVFWPANEKFVEHQHLGGEEIVVLSGQFCDETGCYDKGAWLRNPHLSKHTPFVKQETLIFVKTGHLS